MVTSRGQLSSRTPPIVSSGAAGTAHLRSTGGQPTCRSLERRRVGHADGARRPRPLDGVPRVCYKPHDGSGQEGLWRRSGHADFGSYRSGGGTVDTEPRRAPTHGDAGAAAAGVVDLTTLGTPYVQDFNTLAAHRHVEPRPAGLGVLGVRHQRQHDLHRRHRLEQRRGHLQLRRHRQHRAGVRRPPQRDASSRSSAPSSATAPAATPITSLAISYTGEQWRLGQVDTGRAADRLDFQLSTNATSLTTGTWTDRTRSTSPARSCPAPLAR